MVEPADKAVAGAAFRGSHMNKTLPLKASLIAAVSCLYDSAQTGRVVIATVVLMRRTTLAAAVDAARADGHLAGPGGQVA
jgi:hypothetical protein